MSTTTGLSTYHLLGRTGLRVSPLALGAMTFGNDDLSWGADKDTSRAILHRYVAAGGNFVDTANAYGNSEELLGELLAETGLRDQLVLATKFTGARRPGDPNAAGNGRKNILASLDASLRRLRTDYIDLYWLHVWDRLTLRPRRSCPPWTRWCGAGRSGRSGSVTCPRGTRPRHSCWHGRTAGSRWPHCSCRTRWSSAASSGSM